jgi:hypothetical protein
MQKIGKWERMTSSGQADQGMDSDTGGHLANMANRAFVIYVQVYVPVVKREP